MPPNSELRDVVERYLPYIDRLLAQSNERVIQRPFLAACILVSEIMIGIKGDTKDDFMSKPWFTPIYQAIADWYRIRYGDAATRRHGVAAPGVVLLYETPFELRIPLIVTRVETPGETMWMVFPSTVLPEEDIHDWFVAPPNWVSLSPDELNDLDKRIIKVIESIRSIRINLLSVDYNDDSLQRLSASINNHVDESARKILSQTEEALSLVFWEMHLAVEKSLKALLRQQDHSPCKTHDLAKLYKLAKSRVGLSFEQSLLDSLPSDEEVIRLRYGECELSRSVQDAVAVYNTMLDIVLACTGALKRELDFHNTAFLFEIPPWRRK